MKDQQTNHQKCSLKDFSYTIYLLSKIDMEDELRQSIYQNLIDYFEGEN